MIETTFLLPSKKLPSPPSHKLVTIENDDTQTQFPPYWKITFARAKIQLEHKSKFGDDEYNQKRFFLKTNHFDTLSQRSMELSFVQSQLPLFERSSHFPCVPIFNYSTLLLFPIYCQLIKFQFTWQRIASTAPITLPSPL